MCRIFFVIVATSLCSQLAYAQVVPPSINFWEHYLIRNFSNENIPISDEVFWTHESSDGFIWIAGSSGLTRFDGISTKHINEQSISGLDASVFYEVVEDHKGNLWIPSIGGGVFRFTDDSSKVITEAQGLSSNIVKTLAITFGDTVWVGTYGAGLNAVFQDSVIASYTSEDGMIGDVIWRLMLDSNNKLWIGTKNGLSIFDGNTFTNFSSKNGLPHNAVQGITEMENGEVWIGTDGGGIVIFEEYKPKTYISTKNGLSNDFPQFFAQNPIDKSIWIATHGGGLDRYLDGEVLNINQEDGLVSNFLTHIGFSKNGMAWVSSEDGISQFRLRKVRTLTQNHGLTLSHIPALLSTKKGALWFGTDGKGYNKYDHGSWTYFDVNAKETIAYANSIAENSVGDIWFSTQGSGIFRIKNDKIDRKTSVNEGLTDPTARALEFDQYDNLWVGTNNGLNKMTPKGEIFKYTTDDGLPNNFIITLLNSQNNGLYVGTFGGGLGVFKDNIFSVFDTTNGLSGNKVISLFEDSNQDIWIGTSNSGLNKISNGVITSYKENDGLFNNAISSIKEDDLGNLWFGSGDGIFTVPLSDFNRYDNQEISLLNATNFTLEDGLSALQLESANNRTSAKAKDGSLLFASTAGVEVVHPSVLSIKAPEARTYIDFLVINERSTSSKEPLQINARENKLEIHYSAFNFYAPNKTTFRIKLDGLEDSWNEVHERTIAYYDYLPDGNYTFLVSATNADGEWSEPASLPIIVLPPFYKTWWFRSLALLSFGMVIAGVVRIQSNVKVRRLNQELMMQQKVQKERERISRDLHDNVGSQITNLITGLEISNLHIQKNEQDKAIELISNLDKNARGAMTELRESIWLLDRDSINLSEFESHFKSYTKKHSYSLNGLRLIFKNEANPDLTLNPTQSLHLLRIIQEAFNNCRKYAAAKTFTVQIKERDSILDILLSDNGKGMSENVNNQGGNGLKNMRTRASEIGGTFQLSSTPNKGTKIQISIPIIP